MSDVLVELGKSRELRSFLRVLGLPLPLPEVLARESGPTRARPLADRAIVVARAEGAELLAEIARSLAAAGADPWLFGEIPREPFVGPGETFGRPARAFSSLAESARVHAIVLDASGIASIAALGALHEVFHALLPRLGKSGRVVVLGRPVESGRSGAAAAAQSAIEGFVRSVAKEIGRNGSTANLIRVEAGAEARLDPVLRFVLSARSAFVSGQPIGIDARASAVVEPPIVRGLDGKTALVTGAARGIGAATARRLAAEGAHVVCLDRPADETATSQLARAISGTPLSVDLASAGAADRVAEACAELRSLDVIVHNAGITRDKTLGRMSRDQWDQVLGVNLAAVDALHTGLAPLLTDHARVVCLSSIAGLAGNVGQTAYAASKAGIVGWVRAEAARLADRGITVNAVAPGFIETRMTAAVPIAIREAGRRLSALGQGGQPEDVAEVIAFLASPGAHGITSRTLRVCGGAFIGA